MKEIIAVLHNIRSLHNVGSMFRTADAAGVSKLYLCGITPQPTDTWGKARPEIHKVALGAEATVPWEYARSTSALLKRLKRDGYAVYVVEQSQKSIPYTSARALPHKKIALVMGNEVEGISSTLLKNADKIFEIPMHGSKESLNVSVAFGIVVFELRRV